MSVATDIRNRIWKAEEAARLARMTPAEREAEKAAQKAARAAWVARDAAQRQERISTLEKATGLSRLQLTWIATTASKRDRAFVESVFAQVRIARHASDKQVDVLLKIAQRAEPMPPEAADVLAKIAAKWLG